MPQGAEDAPRVKLNCCLFQKASYLLFAHCITQMRKKQAFLKTSTARFTQESPPPCGERALI